MSHDSSLRWLQPLLPSHLSAEGTGYKGEETPLSDHEATSVSLGHSSSPYQEEFFFIFEVIFAVVMGLLHRPRVVSQNNEKMGSHLPKQMSQVLDLCKQVVLYKLRSVGSLSQRGSSSCWETRLGNGWFHCEPFFALSA